MNFNKSGNQWFPYTPQSCGNPNDPNPMTVEIHPLSHGEIMEYTGRITRGLKKGSRNQFEDNSDKVQEKQFCDNVKNIQHCEDGEDIITDVKVFYHRMPFDIIKEIIGAMEDISVLNDAEKKASESQSGPVQAR